MFLQSTYNFCKGYSEIQVEGYFVERFVNLCLIRNIKIWDIERVTEGTIRLKIYEKDLKTIDELLKITYSKMKIIDSAGVPKIKRLYKKRYNFIIVSICSCVLINVLSLFIWDIQITGNKTIKTEEIYELLNKEGLKIGKLKDEIDCEKMKNNIYIKRDDVLWLGVNIKGVKAVVEVVERLNPEKELEIPCNIVADKDGFIQKITVRNGCKMVDINQNVQKGDILVSGIMKSEYSDDIKVCADADIHIKTWYTDKIAIPYEQSVLTLSGNIDNKYRLRLGNYAINLTNTSTNFEKYDTINVIKKLKLFGKFELPVELEVLGYREYIKSDVKYTKAQAENVAKDTVYKSVLKSLPSDAEVLNCDYKIYHSNNEVIVRIVVECAENIGIKEPLTF